MAHPTVQTSTIKAGTHLTDFATVDLVVEGLAAGGMGLVVWGQNAARNRRMQALKLLKPERVALAARHSSEQRCAIERQFEEEALVWCHVWFHQCVVATTGLTRLSALGDLPALVLEYVPNGSLRDQFRLGTAQHSHPPLRAALAWAIHIASALAHIHQPDAAHDRPAPLVHCDLKPENVLIDEHGWAQLTDLGLTRAYAALAAETESPAAPGTAASGALPDGRTVTSHQAEVARLRAVLQAAGALPVDPSPPEAAQTLVSTRTLRIPPAPADYAAIGTRGPVAGSPPYMAPEQWLGLDAAVPPTDLYAFGVLLYELFAGTETPHPFPFDPSRFLTPELYAHALATGYDPALLAWHAAHMTGSQSGPDHRLTDAEVMAAALRGGPLADIVGEGNRGYAAGRAAAEEALRKLDTLIMACLRFNPDARPSARDMVDQLSALALDPCALDPIQSPQPQPVNASTEDIFWNNLGMTYSMLHRQEEAIAAKRRALEHNPTDSVNWVNLSASLSHLGEEEQRQASDAAAAGRTDEAESSAAASRRHFEEALAACQQAEAHLTPEVLATYSALANILAINQGSVLDLLGRYAEAVAAYQRALALQPDSHAGRFNLALTYTRWSGVPEATPSERLARLQAAQHEIEIVLAAAPDLAGARGLAAAIARSLADSAHRFQG